MQLLLRNQLGGRGRTTWGHPQTTSTNTLPQAK
ncbi:hypothetical protein LEMLEM_LOCUS7149, partial [Lemmus lemmus]